MNGQPIYAGFWKRFAACFIDALILLLPQWLFGFLVASAYVNSMSSSDPVQASIGSSIVSRGVGIGIAWLYIALLESSKYQATVGKMALGLAVTDLNGERITFGRASGRFFGRLLSAILAGVGFLIQPFTSRRQTLHDILAGCLVIRRESDQGMRDDAAHAPPTPAFYESAMPKNHDSDPREEAQYDDEQFYLVAQKEIDDSSVREGLWVKAFTQHPNDENSRRAAYIALRVRQMNDERRSQGLAERELQKKARVGTVKSGVKFWTIRVLKHALLGVLVFFPLLLLAWLFDEHPPQFDEVVVLTILGTLVYLIVAMSIVAWRKRRAKRR